MRGGESTIVYVVSPDRKGQLFRSLHSLLLSGTTFDSVRVYCVGSAEGSWGFADGRIRVEQVRPLFGEYFYGNKLYLCDAPGERVLFLDADTIVLRPLDDLWRGREEDFLARRGTAMSMRGWNGAIWRSMFQDIGAPVAPMFNAGLLMFQRGSHARLKRAWQTALQQFLAGALPCPWHDKRMYEQWSLSLALARERISFGELGRSAHAFGWLNENRCGAAVLHYGNLNGKPFRASLLPPPRPGSGCE